MPPQNLFDEWNELLDVITPMEMALLRLLQIIRLCHLTPRRFASIIVIVYGEEESHEKISLDDTLGNSGNDYAPCDADSTGTTGTTPAPLSEKRYLGGMRCERPRDDVGKRTP